MTIAEESAARRIVGGVDTHKDLHVAAVVDEQDRVLATHSFATTARATGRCSPGCDPSVRSSASASNRPAAMAPDSSASYSRPASRSWRSQHPTSTIAAGVARTTTCRSIRCRRAGPRRRIASRRASADSPGASSQSSGLREPGPGRRQRQRHAGLCGCPRRRRRGVRRFLRQSSSGSPGSTVWDGFAKTDCMDRTVT